MNYEVLNNILADVEKPARYTGEELNSIKKDFNSEFIKFAFCFPDTYEVGMSNLGLKILYDIINDRSDSLCERVFMPSYDMLLKMKESKLPLFSLENKKELKCFDIVGFTLQYEMTYTNILEMLNMGNISVLSENRKETEPIVIAGGPCVYNPEPLYKFIDAFIIGDGEEVTNEIIDVVKQSKLKSLNRNETLLALSKLKGVYVPSFYNVNYNEDGTIKEFKAIIDDVPQIIEKRIVYDFNKVKFPTNITVPYIQIIHDRIFLEIMRGCTRGCRFCQAGMLYRPRREKSPETLVKLAKELVKNSGYEEISLSSLSSGDYSCLNELMMKLNDELSGQRVSISLPSLRLDGNIEESLNETQKVKKSSLTFAPEAGTQRLRNVINKNVTEEDLVRNVKYAFNNGWNNIKLYFMTGLPTETEEDLQGIADLANLVKNEYYCVEKSLRAKGLKITVSTAVFIPKAFTPFQWCAQDDMDTIEQKQLFLKNALNIRSVNFNWHDAKTSRLESAFARGDRKVADVLYTAWKNGCMLDGWREHFKYEIWLEAFKENNVDIDFYTIRKRNKDEIFPWDFINAGIDKDFLYREYEKALKEKTTDDCFYSHCYGCGVQKTEGGCPLCV